MTGEAGSASVESRWLAELEELARSVLPAPVFDYLLHGARDGLSAAEATSSWRSVRIAPHVLRDVTEVDLSVTLLGQKARVPWGIAPTTLQRAVHPDGELAMARAAAAVGAVMVVSSNAGTRFAEIGATGVRWWLQAYLPADRTLAEPMLERAVAAGAAAVVLTVDTPVVGTKYAHPEDPVVWDVIDRSMLRVNFDPAHQDLPGADKALDLGPHDLDWLAERTGLPIVVKGVLRPDDARRCIQAGARAVWVSNHGGRQLDRAMTPAAALEAVVTAVEGKGEVYVDGGLRSGLDVVTALALGADATFLGRLPLFALALGEAGLARMHAELQAQSMETMRLAGCRRVSDTRGIVAG